ncbi:Rossman fold protein, TIGR00730 family [Candidatus Kaiserbacteria bacterium RIFOXYD1_FULL_47_14]|uniref:Cytokinin riboside 5'-monophosphate phosphoribohydrolase n=1 Tax=Candidatus Kaiserbacteria bacterium RIFOXYD1_FULL_47_14 TaxID=1798533 RepID=A0A1F6G3V6_9BACT|nr:MAG: Rossman fold protein, TIGR00730 family [Candidatus Kaiserbacteria bacterium RIFOXYD1_FULL_47_14]
MLVCKPKNIESWRVFKIMSEFVEGFDIIRKYGLAVTIFGTARASFEDIVYKDAEALAGRLAKKGFAVITGGSAGVMQAANKGAFEAGGASVGLNINLPDTQYYNPYLTEKFSFDHFFVRKVILTYASEVYVYFPGGLGTLNEFFEIITLVQTGKIRKVPMILFGRGYWTPLLSFIEKTLYQKHSAIDEKDMDLYIVVDSVDEAYDYIIAHTSC